VCNTEGRYQNKGERRSTKQLLKEAIDGERGVFSLRGGDRFDSVGGKRVKKPTKGRCGCYSENTYGGEMDLIMAGGRESYEGSVLLA